MNSPESSVVFHDVCKNYQLYQNQWQMVRGALGFKNKEQAQTFHALKNINLDIKKGDRVGLVGRNGAGKSTLLKLMTGNFTQSSGVISITGNLQSLMNTGIGFHPEFTGLENIKASLVYNGLDRKQFDAAIEDIIDFVELGEFLHQPFKTILIMEHVINIGGFLYSIKQALKPGGQVTIRVPYKENLINYAAQSACKYEFAHLRDFDKHNLKRLIGFSGLKVNRVMLDSFSLQIPQNWWLKTQKRMDQFMKFQRHMRKSLKNDSDINLYNSRLLRFFLLRPLEIAVIAQNTN